MMGQIPNDGRTPAEQAACECAGAAAELASLLHGKPDFYRSAEAIAAAARRVAEVKARLLALLPQPDDAERMFRAAEKARRAEALRTFYG